MIVLPPPQNVIHLLGIILFSTNLSSDHHMQAVMPSMADPGTQLMASDHVHGAGHPWHGIEPHVAVIAYRDSDRVSLSSEWKAAPLSIDPADKTRYSYVQLNGERVQITPDSPPKTVQSATAAHSATHTAVVDQEHAIDIPYLDAKELLPEYRPPAFSGAAAVFDLPQGKAHGCTWGNRVDVELTVPNEATITIQAGSKKLVLKRGATLFIAHVPRQALSTNVADSAAHLTAYTYMTSSPAAAKVVNTTTPLKPCSSKPPLDQGVFSVGMDFQCSAVTWP